MTPDDREELAGFALWPSAPAVRREAERLRDKESRGMVWHSLADRAHGRTVAGATDPEVRALLAALLAA